MNLGKPKGPDIRFALLGCGRIAKNHVGPLLELPGARLVSLCDLDLERARRYSQSSEIPVYSNYHDMMRSEKIDVVSILTPSGMHAEHAMDIMDRYQKHVVLEKPPALTINDMNRMNEVAVKNGVKIFPIYQNRYNKAVSRVRSDISDGIFGKIALATIRLRWCRKQPYYDRDPWRGTWAMDGGALTNQGIHYIDLLQYLVGDVESVFSRIATQLVNVEVEDTAVATIRFKSGALGVVEVTTAARPDDFEASISILGEHGSAVLTGIACNKLSVYTIDPSAIEKCSEEFPDAYGFGHWPFFADVVTELQDAKPHPISFEEGCKGVKLLNWIYSSSELNREILSSETPVTSLLGRRDEKLAELYRSRP